MKIIAVSGTDQFVATVSTDEIAVLLGFSGQYSDEWKKWRDAAMAAAGRRDGYTLPVGTEIQVQPIGHWWSSALSKERDLLAAAKTMRALADLITTNLPSGIIEPPAPPEEDKP